MNRMLIQILLILKATVVKKSASSGRKPRDCPLCASTALRKLSDHLIQVHKISDRDERLRILQSERKVPYNVCLIIYKTIKINTISLMSMIVLHNLISNTL